MKKENKTRRIPEIERLSKGLQAAVAGERVGENRKVRRAGRVVIKAKLLR